MNGRNLPKKNKTKQLSKLLENGTHNDSKWNRNYTHIFGECTCQTDIFILNYCFYYFVVFHARGVSTFCLRRRRRSFFSELSRDCALIPAASLCRSMACVHHYFICSLHYFHRYSQCWLPLAAVPLAVSEKILRRCCRFFFACVRSFVHSNVLVIFANGNCFCLIMHMVLLKKRFAQLFVEWNFMFTKVIWHHSGQMRKL